MKTLITAEAVVTAAGRRGTSVLIENGSVISVGDRDDLLTPGVVEHTHTDGFIVPGLRDAHIHAAPYAALLNGCSLKSAKSIPDLLDRLREYERTLPTGEPVVATRFDDEHLAEQRLPTRRDLDLAIPNRPVVIYRYCGHIAVANSRALEMSGITEASRNPEGGTIDRGPAGEPTGVLRETAAGLVASALERGQNLSPEHLLAGLYRLASLGLTSIGAMIGYGESPSDKLEAEVALWASIADQLPIRVNAFLIASQPDELQSAVAVIADAGPRLQWLGVKRFADGSLGGHTAAMSRRYSDIDSLGTYRLTDSDVAVARRSLELGGTVAIHAIGDRAVEGVLDVFEGLIAEGFAANALRMEHVSVIAPDQIERFSALGVTACVQPAFLASEADWLINRVGEDRAGWVYPFRSMLLADIPMAGSSDCPVEPPHPLWGIAGAVHRHGISPEEALSGTEALHLFTDGAAASLREPACLAPGSPGDLTVIDVDISRASADSIHSANVVCTYVDGEVVNIQSDTAVWVD